MTSPVDDDPLQSTSVLDTTPSLNVRKIRSPTTDASPDASTISLPIRTSSPPIPTSRSSTLSNAASRSSSPSGRLTQSLARLGRSSIGNNSATPSEDYDTTRSLFVRSFSPTVAVYASAETDSLVERKGIENGFVGLVRPYGENITGKVVIRDSVGSSRAWDDFGVKFRDLGNLVEDAMAKRSASSLEKIEEVLEQYIEHVSADDEPSHNFSSVSPFYRLLLGRLLFSQGFSQHEAFDHPVATVIVISSATPSPIDTLRNLYGQTAQGSATLPTFSNPEYLRYYVLVHDEDHDDFAKSSALFDQMKRHFGLHCHLLRLRSVSVSPEDEEIEELSTSEWLSASEDLARQDNNEQLIDLGALNTPSLFMSDATAIRTFVRELVTQSVIPHMEQRIAFWNDQIASRRRGISGRFTSLSKRWTGIGSLSRATSSASNLANASASGNYDSVQGTYRYDTPEALLRRMADFAFMLRDYKLAASTYELLRTDYSNDKAWKYLAGANEMCCVANLLNPLGTNSANAKLKVEAFDQMLETASYSYLTRCSEPALALRCMLVGVELLKVRGRAANVMATKWAIRALLEATNFIGSIGHVLVSERIASCFSSHLGIDNTGWGMRKRKAALWSIMAAEEWMKLGHAELASARLEEAQHLYAEIKHPDSVKEFKELAEFMQQLQLAVRMKLGQARQRGLSGVSGRFNEHGYDGNEVEEEETIEQIEQLQAAPRGHGRSGSLVPNPLEVPQTPLSSGRLLARDPLTREDDDFE